MSSIFGFSRHVNRVGTLYSAHTLLSVDTDANVARGTTLTLPASPSVNQKINIGGAIGGGHVTDGTTTWNIADGDLVTFVWAGLSWYVANGCQSVVIPPNHDFGVVQIAGPSATPYTIPAPTTTYQTISTNPCGGILRKRIDTVYSQTSTSSFGDLTTATYTGKNISVLAQTTTPITTKFSSDGFTMYVSDGQHHGVVQYVLSVAGDVSSAVYSKTTGNKFSATADGLSNCYFNGFDISADGTKLYSTGTYNSHPYVFMFTLSNPWQVDSVSTYASALFAADISKLLSAGVTLGKSGTRMYLMSQQTWSVLEQYNLSVAYDITSAVYSGKTLALGSNGDPCYAVSFSSDGLRSYHAQQVTSTVFRKVFSVAWELDSASASQSKVVSAQDAAPRGISINASEDTFYVTGASNTRIYQYSMPTTLSYFLNDHVTWTYELI